MKRRTTQKGHSLSREPVFNWQLIDDPQQAEEEIEPARSRQISMRAWLILASSTLLILVAGYWTGQRLMQRAGSNLRQVQGQVAKAVDTENDPSQGGISAGKEISDSSTMTGSAADVTLLQLYGSLAYVDVLVKNPREKWIDEPYHVGRILREGKDGWQPVAPDNRFWGERRALDTVYFHFDYTPPDEEVVRQVAKGLDDYYLHLYSDLGLASPHHTNRIEIRVAVGNETEGSDTNVNYGANTISVYPPELIPRPSKISDAETLRQSIAFPLATKVFYEANTIYETPCMWRPLDEGIGLWLRWEGHTLPSRARWDYERVIAEWSNPLSLPHLNDLLALPRDCWEEEPPEDLDALSSSRPVPHSEISATLIEYLVATYGRQSIPVLLHDFQKYRDWKSLSQQSLHISQEELEASWHTYLLTRSQ